MRGRIKESAGIGLQAQVELPGQLLAGLRTLPAVGRQTGEQVVGQSGWATGRELGDDRGLNPGAAVP